MKNLEQQVREILSNREILPDGIERGITMEEKAIILLANTLDKLKKEL